MEFEIGILDYVEIETGCILRCDVAHNQEHLRRLTPIILSAELEIAKMNLRWDTLEGFIT